jgi:hypothetical protein
MAGRTHARREERIMRIIASIMLAFGIMGSAHHAAPVQRCAEDEIRLVIHSPHGRDVGACIHLDWLDGSRMHDIAIASLRMYGAGHASIIIDSDDAEVLVGRAGA